MTLARIRPNTATAPTHLDPDTVSLLALEQRIEELQHIPQNYADALAAIYGDVRCGCGGEEPCDWDALDVLEHVYAHRMGEAA